MRRITIISIRNLETSKTSIYTYLTFRCSILNEEKIRLEYDLKQRTESMNKQILELRTENENLQLTLNDKYITYIYSDLLLTKSSTTTITI